MNKDDLVKFYNSGYGYHTLEFPDGFILEGKYDMKTYLKNFRLPENLQGMTVLDVAPANGYFSFEFAKRGAKVTAIDKDDQIWKNDINKLMKTDVTFKIKDANTLDESFGSFDIVFVVMSCNTTATC